MNKTLSALVLAALLAASLLSAGCAAMNEGRDNYEKSRSDTVQGQEIDRQFETLQ